LTFYLTATKQLIKRNTSYLVGTAISPIFSYLLAVKTGRQYCYLF